MARITKKDIYAEYGIEYNNGKIYSPILKMWINPLLINGNKKIGRGVWQWSITAGNKAVNADVIAHAIGNDSELNSMDPDALRIAAGGTCRVNCPGCYAQTGCYLFFSTRVSLARKTLLCKLDAEWTERALMAQIKADKIKYCRIHVAGDFFSDSYVKMWTRIAKNNPDTIFWTYTKQGFKSLAKFDALENANIVKSIIGRRVNYGKAAYIVALYTELKAAGESVYICRCGIDANQHCAGCHHCYSAKYVLFLEHSTNYRPENDPAYNAFIALVNSQEEKAA